MKNKIYAILTTCLILATLIATNLHTPKTLAQNTDNIITNCQNDQFTQIGETGQYMLNKTYEGWAFFVVDTIGYQSCEEAFRDIDNHYVCNYKTGNCVTNNSLVVRIPFDPTTKFVLRVKITKYKPSPTVGTQDEVKNESQTPTIDPVIKNSNDNVLHNCSSDQDNSMFVEIGNTGQYIVTQLYSQNGLFVVYDTFGYSDCNSAITDYNSSFSCYPDKGYCYRYEDLEKASKDSTYGPVKIPFDRTTGVSSRNNLKQNVETQNNTEYKDQTQLLPNYFEEYESNQAMFLESNELTAQESSSIDEIDKN